ncbi:MAG: Neutral endopeptidase [Planctomycetota bacterium]|jgi:putative endopeptidase
MLHRLLLLSIVCLCATATADEPHSGLDPDGFDKSVRAQDDLFLHVNGRWLMSTEIPSDKSNYGSFTRLDDEARENIRTIIEEAVNNPTDAISRKVGDFYRSYMNEQLIEARGLAPIREHLAAVDSLATPEDVTRFFASAGIYGMPGPIGFYVSVDDKNSGRYLVHVVQSGLTLPDRDYYLGDRPDYKSARTALRTYITRLFELAEIPDGAAAADQIIQLETALADIQWSRTELRDAEKRYNLMPAAKLATTAPAIPWNVFLEVSGVPGVPEVNVVTPSYFEKLGAVATAAGLDAWKAYARFHLLDTAAPYLPKAFVDAHFELHDKAVSGVPQQKPRWKKAVDATSGAGAGDFGVLGEPLGQLYVRRHFPPESRQRMIELVGNLMKTYEQSIHGLKWMTAETKQKALEKLGKITTKIGYPDVWRDFTELQIAADDLIGNIMRSRRFEHFRQVNRLNEPVDRREWGMTPQTVNAYYNPSLNEIVFPAAILQPPFFDANADDAVNYGGIGAVIGHEISHGFDDEGSKYDGDGNLKNWWTETDRKAFEELTGKLVAQYESYEPLPGRRLNGKLTLGENIADLSGMAIAYKAYMLSLGTDGGKTLDGYTPGQRFFLGWSQIWRRKYRDDEMVRRLLIDPHSPSAFRANGPVANLDAFYEAFGVKPGDRLYKPPAERIQIW